MDGRQMGRVGTGRGPPWMSRFSVRPVYMVIIVTVITRMPTSTFCGYAAVDPASALYDHPALVDDRNPVGELICLVQAHWVVRSTVVPPATSARMISQTWLRLRGSNPVVGSSGGSGQASRRCSRRCRSAARIRPE